MTFAQEVLYGLRCPYCEQKTELVDSEVVYGRSYGPIWMCTPCHAYVGCHKGTTNALGTVANEDLRTLRKAAHANFDPLWRTSKRRGMNRTIAYKWLAQQLGIEDHHAHIGMFDETLCQRVIELCWRYAHMKREHQQFNNPIHG